MTLLNLKEHFYHQLKNDLSANEIELAFNLLIEKFFGKDQAEIKSNPEIELTGEQQDKFEKALLRLKNHEPIQYILEEAKFFGRYFKVNSNVHVPRPESETMMEWVIEDFKGSASNKTILDIGTGCGVLSISLAKEFPGAEVYAIDISDKALDVARENAQLNTAEVNFLQTDILQLESLPKKVDILVSNPPYVKKLEKRDVQRNFLDHEPAVALYVEDGDPMVFNRKIAELAKKDLSRNGAVYVEINQYLAAETAQVFREKGFETEVRKDVFGKDRTVKAFWPN